MMAKTIKANREFTEAIIFFIQGRGEICSWKESEWNEILRGFINAIKYTKKDIDDNTVLLPR